MAHTYKKDVEEYIFTRPEMAKLLGISTNALRCRMRKGKCDLEYRFDGKNFLYVCATMLSSRVPIRLS